MDMMDVVAACGLEWLYDKVEKRYGKAAAWCVTIFLTAVFVAVCVGIVLAFN